MILFAPALPAAYERPVEQVQPPPRFLPPAGANAIDRKPADEDEAPKPAKPAIRPPRVDPGVQAAEDGRIVRPPTWRRRPSAADIQEAYPQEALADGVGGQGVLICEVELDSTLSRCVAPEPPKGYGFGAAALSLAASFRIRPETIDGEPVVHGLVVAPVRFDPPDDASPPKVGWTASPTAAEVRAAMPRPGGKPATTGGRGVIRCTVTGGLLSDCRPVGDVTDPFSRAAIKLAPKFLLEKSFLNGKPVEGTIFDIPVMFDAPNTTPPPAVLEDPVRFIRAPTNAQKNAVFPQAAKDHGVTTLAVTEACVVAPDGSLTRCRATREEPVGVGGAEAATRLVNAFQLPTWSSEGRPIAGAPVTVDIVWAAPAAGAASGAAPPPSRATPGQRPPARRR